MEIFMITFKTFIKNLLRVRLELTTSACLNLCEHREGTDYKYGALTDCATGAVYNMINYAQIMQIYNKVPNFINFFKYINLLNFNLGTNVINNVSGHKCYESNCTRKHLS